MKRVICPGLMSVLVFVACNKREPQGVPGRATGPGEVKEISCGKEITTDKAVKVGETDIILPVGTKLCIPENQMEVRVELPTGFAFVFKEQNVMEKTLPVYATYSCSCSQSGSACNVFYMEGMGFGCLQSSCTASCTGKFTYKGYEVTRIIHQADKTEFFSAASVQNEIRRMTNHVSPLEAYSRFSVMGISFYLVQDEAAFLAKASCDCEGTQACKLKTISLPLMKGDTANRKIYYCDGGCNGCELTV